MVFLHSDVRMARIWNMKLVMWNVVCGKGYEPSVTGHGMSAMEGDTRNQKPHTQFDMESEIRLILYGMQCF